MYRNIQWYHSWWSILWCCTETFNDTIVGDPFYEVPLNMLCISWGLLGEVGKVFNLISDGCVQVNANYSAMHIPENGNIISHIGVFVNVVLPLWLMLTIVFLWWMEHLTITQFISWMVWQLVDEIRVRISVPNCDNKRPLILMI